MCDCKCNAIEFNQTCHKSLLCNQRSGCLPPVSKSCKIVFMSKCVQWPFFWEEASVFQLPSRPVLPFCPFWLHTFICLNSPELHCWLSSHPHCIKMLGLCFRVYVRRSQGAGTDPAKDSMPRACRRGQGLPSDLPKDSLCLHLVVIDCKFVVRKVFGMTLPKTACPGHAIELDALKYPILSALRKGTDFLQTQ